MESIYLNDLSILVVVLLLLFKRIHSDSGFALYPQITLLLKGSLNLVTLNQQMVRLGRSQQHQFHDQRISSSTLINYHSCKNQYGSSLPAAEYLRVSCEILCLCFIYLNNI